MDDMEILVRQHYLDKIEKYLGKDMIIVLTGQRRVGKSYTLRMIRDIKAKDGHNNIIYVDKYNSHILLNNAKLVGNNYLTLDEKCFLTNLSYDEVINLPKVETIKQVALAYRTNLKSVNFNEEITSVKYQAFFGCVNLENVYFNYGLKEIQAEAFYDCESLDYVVIPDTVKYIGSKAFNSGTIFSNTTFVPESWADDFAVGKAKVYFKHRWYYDENGIPRPKDSI